MGMQPTLVKKGGGGEELDVTGTYKLTRPNTWPENTQLNFGDGLFGYRSTGSGTTTFDGYSGQTYQKEINYRPDTFVKAGGTITVNTLPYAFTGVNGFSSSQNKFSGASCIRTSGGKLNVYIYALGNSPVPTTHDIWVTYTS